MRLKAERDVVVVMSACPQDILDINNKTPTDAHFIVEGDEQPAQAVKRTQMRKRPPPRKISSSHATSTIGTEAGITPARRPVPQRKTTVGQKKPVPAASNKSSTMQPAATKSTQSSSAQPQPARKKPAPAPVAPQNKAPQNTASEAPPADATGGTTSSAAPQQNSVEPSTADANGAAPPPVQKKKPRKLNPKPKVEAQGAN